MLYYYRTATAWRAVSDPRHAPAGVRLWTADELVFEIVDGRTLVRAGRER